MPGPWDVPDPKDIITELRKQKAPAHLHDSNNTLTDPTLKHLQKEAPQQNPTTNTQPHSRSPSIELVEDQDEIPKNNLPPHNPKNILEADDNKEDDKDEERSRGAHPKLKKNQHHVVLGSDDEDKSVSEESDTPQPKKKGEGSKRAPQLRKELEEPEIAEEDAESMLGEWTNLEFVQQLTFPLDHLISTWTSSAYAFFDPRPTINTHHDRCCLEFVCGTPQCKGQGNKKERRIVRRYLDPKVSKDGKVKVDNSTGNLYKHARKCWGEETVAKAVEANDLAVARQGLVAAKVLTDSSITATFERTGKGKVTFSTKPLTYPKTW
jgi:hypothetical protein